MKKVIIGIISALVGAIVITAVVLCLVVTKPFGSLSDYEIAYIYENSEASPHIVSRDIEEAKDKKLRSLLSGNGYSAMQSLLSGRTQLDNEYYKQDGEDVTIGETEIKGNGLYDVPMFSKFYAKIKLSFDEKKKATIGKSSYTFDTVEFFVPSTSGEIREITCVAYDYSAFDVQTEETQYIKFATFKIHANTTELYNFIVTAWAD